MIDLIMRHPLLQEKPPVLFDLGASGSIHYHWRPIAKYSICVAFDPDDRDVSGTAVQGKGFRDFYMINRIVSDKEGETDFFLTESPYCSSTLESNLPPLKKYEIPHYFEIKKRIKLPAITVTQALKMLNLNYIDWYKSDTQGTDLRIFKAMDESVIQRIIVAEFEPGIMDAYHGEDKLWSVMEYFDERKDFFCDDCTVKGMARITLENKKKIFRSFLENRYFDLFLKKTAYWAEISYFSEMDRDHFEKRDFLLAIVFAIIKKQYGYVLELAERAKSRFGEDPLWEQVQKYAIRKIKTEGWIRLLWHILKRAAEKLL